MFKAKKKNFCLEEVPAHLEEKTQAVSHSGTFQAGDLKINKDGLRGVSVHCPSSDLLDLVRLEDLEVGAMLGSGSGGVVNLAVHRPTGRKMALKKINVFDESKRGHIVKELQTLYRTSSPFLVSFHGAFYHEGSILIALELMDCGSVSDVLKATGPLPEPVLSRIIASALQGLAYLHKEKHLVHRDIKPSNMLMDSLGRTKITDFGISTELSSTMADCGTFVGTLTYMSPERILGEKYSFPSDIWSIGLAVIECATGQFPYSAQPLAGGRVDTNYFTLLHFMQHMPPPSLDHSFSPEIRDFVNVCLQKSPELRPSAVMLLTHPFITKYSGIDISPFMTRVPSVLRNSSPSAAIASALESLVMSL